MNDTEIIDLYFARNEDAIGETQVKYGRYLFTVADSILSDDGESEECVNDTYLHAWNSMPPERPSILRIFLARITRNLSLNVYEAKRAKKRGSGETALILDELSELVSDPSGSFDNAELVALRELIRGFVCSLDGEKKQMFILRYWYCFSVKETARVCRVTESKVKMTLLRLRQQLKETLTKGGISL